jgi:hypothetical protein
MKFREAINAFVYEGRKTEVELAMFIDPSCQFADGNGPHAVLTRWIYFSDMSCVLYIPGRCVLLDGTIEGNDDNGWTIEI